MRGFEEHATDGRRRGVMTAAESLAAATGVQAAVAAPAFGERHGPHAHPVARPRPEEAGVTGGRRRPEAVSARAVEQERPPVGRGVARGLYDLVGVCVSSDSVAPLPPRPSRMPRRRSSRSPISSTAPGTPTKRGAATLYAAVKTPSGGSPPVAHPPRSSGACGLSGA